MVDSGDCVIVGVTEGPREHGVGGQVNPFGIEAPALTACLAIARHVRLLL